MNIIMLTVYTGIILFIIGTLLMHAYMRVNCFALLLFGCIFRALSFPVMLSGILWEVCPDLKTFIVALAFFVLSAIALTVGMFAVTAAQSRLSNPVGVMIGLFFTGVIMIAAVTDGFWALQLLM